MAEQVFLSYSRQDAALMRQVRDFLADSGFTVWTDEGIEPGTPSWKQAIENGIRESSALVVLFSPDSSESKWVRSELDFAEAQGVHIFPLLVRGDERTAVPFGFTTHNWIDLRDTSDVNSALKPLPDVIRGRSSTIERPPAPTSPVTQEKSTNRTVIFVLAGLFAVVLVVGLILLAANGDDGETQAALTEEPAPTTVADAAQPAVNLSDDGWQTVEQNGVRVRLPDNWTEIPVEMFGAIIASNFDEDVTESFATLVSMIDLRLLYGDLLTFEAFGVVNDEIGVVMPMDVIEQRTRQQYEVMDILFDEGPMEAIMTQWGEGRLGFLEAGIGTQQSVMMLVLVPIETRAISFAFASDSRENARELADAILPAIELLDVDTGQQSLTEATQEADETTAPDDEFVLPDGWQWAEGDQITMAVPENWLVFADDNTELFNQTAVLLVPDLADAILGMAEGWEIQLISGNYTAENFVSVGAFVDTLAIAATPEFLEELYGALLNDMGASETTMSRMLFPAGEAIRMGATLPEMSIDGQDMRGEAYAILQPDGRTVFIVGAFSTPERYVELEPTIEMMMQSVRATSTMQNP